MSEWRRLPGALAAWTRGSGPRLVFVHGFTQTAQSWRHIAESFADDGWQSVIVDAPGHGDSLEITAEMAITADALAEQVGGAVYVGYSMGARLCLHIAVAHPHAVSALALIGGSPGIADASERAARKAADNALAQHVEDVGVDTFLDEWLAQPLFAGLHVDEDARADRLRNTAAGLASSLRAAGTGAQASLWDALPMLSMPVLAIAGESDTKYVDIGRRMAAAVPRGSFVAIPQAGHAAHLQRPDAVTRELRDWLNRTVRSAADRQAGGQQ